MEQALIEAVKWLLSQQHDAFHPKVRAEAQAHLTAIAGASTPSSTVSVGPASGTFSTGPGFSTGSTEPSK
jgi:hypothetical protein